MCSAAGFHAAPGFVQKQSKFAREIHTYARPRTTMLSSMLTIRLELCNACCMQAQTKSSMGQFGLVMLFKWTIQFALRVWRKQHSHRNEDLITIQNRNIKERFLLQNQCLSTLHITHIVQLKIWALRQNVVWLGVQQNALLVIPYRFSFFKDFSFKKNLSQFAIRLKSHRDLRHFFDFLSETN